MEKFNEETRLIILGTVTINSFHVVVQEFDHRQTKWRQVAGGAAGDQVAVDDHRFVYPDATGVFQIVLDAEGAGDPFTIQNLRRDGNPAAVADEGDEFSLLEKFAGQGQDLGVTPE